MTTTEPSQPRPSSTFTREAADPNNLDSRLLHHHHHDDDDDDEDETRLLMEDATSQNNGSRKKSIGSSSQTDFVFIKIIARITLQFLRKFWAFSSAAALSIFLFYWLCGGFIAFGLVTFAISGILYHVGDRILYHPDMPANSRVFVPPPSTMGLDFENVYIRSQDGIRLHMFFIKQSTKEATSKAVTFLYLHGNAGNIGHRVLMVKDLVDTLGFNVCLLDYRGYGHSDGTPSEEGLYRDAQAALDYLHGKAEIDHSKILVFGRSLGGAVALNLASREENHQRLCAVILENTFTGIPEVARVVLNFRPIRWIPKWFYKNQFGSKWKAANVCIPVLFLSGSADTLIPPSMMNELYASCGSHNKILAKFPGGTHNDTWSCPQYLHTIAFFVEKVVGLADKRRSPMKTPTSIVDNSYVV